MAGTGRRVYEELREGIEARGGTMEYRADGREGKRWIVTLAGKSATVKYEDGLFPLLDALYVPLVDDPRAFDDYSKSLVDGAIDRLIEHLQLGGSKVRHFGHPYGIELGQDFADYAALREAGVHLPTVKGISGTKAEGADSIVLSGGYREDEDFGDEIVYTGEVGQEPGSKRQTFDQTLVRGNLALARSVETGLPVRVVRGFKHKSPYSPAAGYRYAGLYRVEEMWHERGAEGFRVYRFRMVGEDSRVEGPSEEGTRGKAPRARTTVQRVVRDSALARRVKEKHKYACQVCGLVIEGRAGRYAEAAHIRPLGSPHDGPDVEGNVLCLCPNHHVMFDHGSFAVGDEGHLLGLPGQLRTARGHRVDPQHLRYHREHRFEEPADSDR